MVESKDIKDSESLENWLTDQPSKVATWIAARAAARILPLWWQVVLTEDWARERNVTALPVLRCLLLSSVAAVRPSEDIRTKAFLAFTGVDRNAGDGNSAFDGISESYTALAFAAGYAAAAINSTNLIAVAVEAVVRPTLPKSTSPPAVNEAILWHEVRIDAAHVENKAFSSFVELWSKKTNPFAGIWADIQKRITAADDKVDWQFWVDWYQSMLDGTPMLKGEARTWEMLEKIALIEPEIWDQGPKEVNSEIVKIWADSSKSGVKLRGKQAESSKGKVVPPSKQDVEKARQELVKVNEAVAAAQKQLTGLQNLINKNGEFALGTAQRLEELSGGVEAEQKRLEETFTEQQEKYDAEASAIRAAFSAENALAAPAKLWEDKREYHEEMADTAYKLFCNALFGIAAFVLLIVAIFALSDLSQLLLPVGCDPVNWTERCGGFGLKSFVTMTAMLTILTVTLWYTRLKMKEFLAERHLALDARERHAFAQAYIGFLKEGDTSEEAKDQRSIVYSALFRPTNDGIVKDEGGLDPSISSAITKVLSR